MAIDSLKAIRAGDSTQWIRVRGADTANPVLLLIQQGPGLPMINEARRFERLLGLEQQKTSAPEMLAVLGPHQSAVRLPEPAAAAHRGQLPRRSSPCGPGRHYPEG
jgi:hypothetical protein